MVSEVFRDLFNITYDNKIAAHRQEKQTPHRMIIGESNKDCDDDVMDVYIYFRSTFSQMVYII